MKHLTIGLLSLTLAGVASAQDIPTVNKGQWETAMSMVTELQVGGERQDIDPEYDFSEECWATDEDTKLDVNTLGIDNCDVTDSVSTGDFLSLEMACDMEGIALTGEAVIVVTPDRDQLQGTLIIEGDMPGMSIKVTGLFSGHKTGACAG